MKSAFRGLRGAAFGVGALTLLGGAAMPVPLDDVDCTLKCREEMQRCRADCSETAPDDQSCGMRCIARGNECEVSCPPKS